MGITFSTFFRVVVYDEISLIFEPGVYQPLVFRCYGMALHPSKSTRSTKYISDISTPAGVCKWVWGRRSWHDRLVCRVSNLRNNQARRQ